MTTDAERPKIEFVVFVRPPEPGAPPVPPEEVVKFEPTSDGFFIGQRVTFNPMKLNTDNYAAALKMWRDFLHSETPAGQLSRARQYYEALPRPFSLAWKARGEELGERIRREEQADSISEEGLYVIKLLIQFLRLRLTALPVAEDAVKITKRQQQAGRDTAKLAGAAHTAAENRCRELLQRNPKATVSMMVRNIQLLLKSKHPDTQITDAGLRPHVRNWRKAVLESC